MCCLCALQCVYVWHVERGGGGGVEWEYRVEYRCGTISVDAAGSCLYMFCGECLVYMGPLLVGWFSAC